MKKFVIFVMEHIDMGDCDTSTNRWIIKIWCRRDILDVIDPCLVLRMLQLNRRYERGHGAYN